MNKLLVISDIHLGSENCNIEKTIDILKKENYQILIINGDLLDSRHLHRLNKEQWNFLNLLRKISKNKKIILIRGNHDFYDAEILTILLGFEVMENYFITINNIKYFFIHGHIFDLAITKFGLFTNFISEIYYYLCKNKWFKERLNIWIHADRHILKTDIKVKNKAKIYKKRNESDWIVCGHTHFAEIDESIGYLNSGSCCGNDISYITISNQGVAKLIKI
jgi:predicted phosphodiesterase